MGSAVTRENDQPEQEFELPMMLAKMRNSTIFVAIVFGLGMLGWFMMDFELDQPQQVGGVEELGRVNGQPVGNQMYQTAYQQASAQIRQQTEGNLSSSQLREAERMAWDQVVNEMLLEQEIRRRGITVRDGEIRQAALMYPHPELMQSELFQTDGQFDMQRYRQFISGPQAPDDVLVQIEQYYREVIPRNKLIRQVTAGYHLTDADLWRAWRDERETATADYVLLDPESLVTDDIAVSEDDIRAYYRDNPEQFRRPASMRADVAFLTMTATAADSAEVRERAETMRQSLIAGDADFAELAEEMSADAGSRSRGGDLGTFRRGQMVEAFDEAVFTLPVGEVSEPVQTPFGIHLIEVLERSDDEARARHILLSMEPSDEALDEFYGAADRLEEVAEAEGLERAVEQVEGATLRRSVQVHAGQPVVADIGSLEEALVWADLEREEDESMLHDPSPLFESGEALYVVRIEAFDPEGTVSLEDAAPRIRAELERRARREQAREIGDEMVGRIRDGESLEEVAAEHGLEVQSTDSFTRADPSPALGQGNAATGAAFGTSLGEVSDVAATSTGLYIIRPTERSEADRAEWEEQRAQQRASLQGQVQQQAVGRWLDALRRDADIVDRRNEVLERRI